MTFLVVVLAVGITLWTALAVALAIVVVRLLRHVRRTRSVPTRIIPTQRGSNPICMCTHVRSIHITPIAAVLTETRQGCTARSCDCRGFIERGT